MQKRTLDYFTKKWRCNIQTFMPFDDFIKVANCLDTKRLGKQRVEVLEILNNPEKNHPAVHQWRGYENCLCLYGKTICEEWIQRGYQDTCLNKIMDHYFEEGEKEVPPWINDPQVQRSHRIALLYKNMTWYSRQKGFEQDTEYAQMLLDIGKEYHYIWGKGKERVH